MNVEPEKNIPQGGTRNNGESTPELSSGRPNVSGGGKTLRRVDAHASTAGPLRDQKTMAEKSKIPARGRRGRYARPNMASVGHMIGESGSETSDVSAMSVAPINLTKRVKRKSRPPGTSTVAAKFMALPVSDQETNKSSTSTGAEEDASDAYMTIPKPRPKRNLPILEDQKSQIRHCADTQLGECIEKNLFVIESVADRAHNLKKTLAQDLRLAVGNLKTAAEELSRRKSTELNMERLERENADLHSQVSCLNSKLEKLTEEMKLLQEHARRSGDPIKSTDLRTPTPQIEPNCSTDSSLMDRIGQLIEAKLADFEAKLFPDGVTQLPLGVKSNSRKPESEVDTPRLQQHDVTEKTSLPVKRRRKRKNLLHPPVTDLPPVDVVQPQATSHIEEHTWVSITKKQRQPNNSTQTPAASLIKGRRNKKEIRVPNSAAVTVTIPEGSDTSYAKVMETAKSKIRLADFEIETLRQKRALTGGLLLEIIGPDCGQKADKLAAKMREVFSDVNVKINRPTKKGEIRLRDLDDAISPREVAEAVANAGGCLIDDVKVGEIRRTPVSLGTCWVRCPAKAVRELARVRRIQVGWGSVRVETLEPRPMHCFRCLEAGHVGTKCTNQTNRSGRCYACGDPGHKAKDCTAQAFKCPLCSDIGRPADHRFGKGCSIRQEKSGKETGNANTAMVTGPKTAPSQGSDVEAMEA